MKNVQVYAIFTSLLNHYFASLFFVRCTFSQCTLAQVDSIIPFHAVRTVFMVSVSVLIHLPRAPSGRDPRLRGKVIQTIISKYNMPKDYNYHCSFVWSYNNENVYFRLFSLCIKHIKL